MGIVLILGKQGRRDTTQLIKWMQLRRSRQKMSLDAGSRRSDFILLGKWLPSSHNFSLKIFQLYTEVESILPFTQTHLLWHLPLVLAPPPSFSVGICTSIHTSIYLSKYTFTTFLLLNHLKIGCRYWDISSLNTSTYLPRIIIFSYSAIGFHFFVQEPMKVYAQGYFSLISFNLYYSYWLFFFQDIQLFFKSPSQFSWRKSHI